MTPTRRNSRYRLPVSTLRTPDLSLVAGGCSSCAAYALTLGIEVIREIDGSYVSLRRIASRGHPSA